MSTTKDRLVSAATLRDGLKELQERSREEAPYNPEYVRRREERLLLDFERIVKAAEREYVSTGVAHNLTGWDPATLRKYARLVLDGEPVPDEWSLLVVQREGKEYNFVLASIPPRPVRDAE